MALAKLKETSKTTVIGFNGGGAVRLGLRKDIDKLAIIALESGDRFLLNLFEQPLPTLEQLRKADVDEQLQQGPQKDTPQEIPVPGNVSTANAKLDQ